MTAVQVPYAVPPDGTVRDADGAAKAYAPVVVAPFVVILHDEVARVLAFPEFVSTREHCSPTAMLTKLHDVTDA